MNSTRRKWFADGPDPAPAPPAEQIPAPAPEPAIPHPRRELVPAVVGRARIGVPRPNQVSTPPARGNGGRWRS